MRYDVAVIGGSLGGVQAAISAAEAGKRVYMCEATDWIGGQLTSQAVPPDEHRWIERCGATERYMKYREDVREYYRSLPEVADEVKGKRSFCPGNSWVSRVAHEPKAALKILEGYLEQYIHSGRVVVDYFTEACGAVVDGDIIRSVTVRNMSAGVVKEIEAQFFLDATDCGDLLPVVGAEYRTGAEGRDITGEPHAPETGDSGDMQPITWVAALELNPEGYVKLEKPAEYDFFSNLGVPYDDNKLFSWYAPDAATHKKTEFSMFDGVLEDKPLGLWSYRRIIDTKNYKDGRKEVMLFNWPQNDFTLGNVIDTPDAKRNLELARAQTLCAVYWLQNDAPRPDGGKGYPVGLRPDIMGTRDGLAKAPYIRESRRIVAKRTVCEQDVSMSTNTSPPVFEDSVGVGHYSIDIHMTTKSHTFLYGPAYPFEIPLSAMVPVRLKNLIPACKNIGCTHLTSGCYRLHPVEWNVGEAAGHLAAYCIDNGLYPVNVLEPGRLKCFQGLLAGKGVQLHWDAGETGEE